MGLFNKLSIQKHPIFKTNIFIQDHMFGGKWPIYMIRGSYPGNVLKYFTGQPGELINVSLTLEIFWHITPYE